MNKLDLIAAVADDANLTKGQASEAVDAVFKAIEHALKKEEEVRLVGFGTFATAKRKAGTGRNPAHRRGNPHPSLHLRPLQARQGPEGRGELIPVDTETHLPNRIRERARSWPGLTLPSRSRWRVRARVKPGDDAYPDNGMVASRGRLAQR